MPEPPTPTRTHGRRKSERASAIERVLTAVGARIEAEGYQRVKPSLWTRSFGDGTHGWISLEVNGPPSDLKVAPLVGVRHDRVEELRDRLCSQLERLPFRPTVWEYLLHQVPRGGDLVWYVQLDSFDADIERVTRAIREHGLRAIERWRDLDQTVEALWSAGWPPHSMPARVIAAYLSGGTQRAEQIIASELERITRRPRQPKSDDAFDAFVAAFREHTRERAATP